jgi:hypothetical protein
VLIALQLLTLRPLIHTLKYQKINMALTQDLPISNSMYKLLNLIIDARQQFPKAFRYEFGTELMMLAVHCCEYIRYANTDMNLEHRADYLMKFLCEFDALKLLLRVCEERHLTSLTQTAEICLLAESIGKQSTGWYKKTVADLQRQKANGSQQVAKPES